MSTFDETLNKQIEALHEMVKDTPEYKQKQELEDALRFFTEACQALKPIFDDLAKVVRDLWEEIVRIVKQVVENVAAVYWNMQRAFLLYDLKRKYKFVPDKLTQWAVRLIPNKWLMRTRELLL